MSISSEHVPGGLGVCFHTPVVHVFASFRMHASVQVTAYVVSSLLQT